MTMAPLMMPGYLPFLHGGPVDETAQDPPAPLHFRTFKLPASDPDVLAYGPNGVIGWELKIDDLRGGYLQAGDFARGANPLDGDYRMTSSSTLDQRFRRHLFLTCVEYLNPASAATLSGPAAYWTHVGTIPYMGLNTAVANKSLHQEYPNGSWAPVTYTPPSNIIGLSAIVVGGVSQAERLLVMHGSHPPAVGPTAGSMHANLSPCWGHIMSPLNDDEPGTGNSLFYANNGIWTLPLSAAIGTAPVQVMSNVANGGYAIGGEKLPEGPLGLRAWWVWPRQNNNVVNYTHSSAASYVVSTNLGGTDPLPVPLALNTIKHAAIWRRNIVACDRQRALLWDGDKSRDLHVMGNRAIVDGAYQIDQLIVSENDLLIQITARGNVNGTPHVTWLEQYLPQFDAWVPVTGPLTIANIVVSGDGTNPYSSAFEYTVPVSFLTTSKQTGVLHLPLFNSTPANYFQTSMMFIRISGHNPFYSQQAAGGSTLGKINWTTQGTWTGPWWEFPNLEGKWKRADQVVFLGNVDDANADCSVVVSLNGDSGITFAPGLPNIAQAGDTGSAAMFTQLRVSITINRGNASAYRTPNGIPLLIRGRAYLSEPDLFVAGVPTGP